MNSPPLGKPYNPIVIAAHKSGLSLGNKEWLSASAVLTANNRSEVSGSLAALMSLDTFAEVSEQWPVHQWIAEALLQMAMSHCCQVD